MGKKQEIYVAIEELEYILAEAKSEGWDYIRIDYGDRAIWHELTFSGRGPGGWDIAQIRKVPDIPEVTARI